MNLYTRILGYYKPYRRDICIATLITISSQIAIMISSYFFGRSIDAILIKKDINLFIYMACVFGLAKFITSPLIAFASEQFREERLNHAIPNTTRAEALRHFLSMSGRQHKDHNFLLSSTVIQEGIDAIGQMEGMLFYSIIPLVVYGLIMFGLLLSANYILFAVVLIISTFFCLETVRLNKKIFPRLKDMREKRQQLRGKLFRENLQNVHLIQINGQEESVLQKFIENDNQISNLQKQIWLRYRLWTLIRSSALPVGQTILLVLSGYMIISNIITPGVFVMSWMYVDGIIGQLWSIGHTTRNMIEQTTNIESYFKFLDLEPGIINGSRSIEFGEQPPEIELVNLKYEYKPVEAIGSDIKDQSKHVALKNINLKIQPGECIGLVGHSGAGKTTLFELIMRFDDPTSGKILINGIDLKELELTKFKSQVGYVSQEHQFFNDTFAENLLFPLNGKSPEMPEEKIIELCRIARIDHVLERYPDGLNSKIGDRAKNLSGGEKQRFSIARMLSKNPKLVLLDEATASLDSDNETHIQQVIQETSKGRTTIIIAHRLSTLNFVKRIVVMDKGTILDIGSHDELMGRCELFRDLVKKQSITIDA